MTDTDRRDIINHVMHFGCAAVLHKDQAGKWWIRFREFGFPTPFKTKAAAMERVSQWVSMLSAKRREDAAA